MKKLTTFQWACQTFYVNKRSEQVRKRLRLVIDHKLLYHFLLDDKFPLPDKKITFANLAKSKIFSTFDLKVRFSKPRIKREERLIIAFCILNQHFQWTVMPLGLKMAPSLF